MDLLKYEIILKWFTIGLITFRCQQISAQLSSRIKVVLTRHFSSTKWRCHGSAQDLTIALYKPHIILRLMYYVLVYTISINLQIQFRHPWSKKGNGREYCEQFKRFFHSLALIIHSRVTDKCVRVCLALLKGITKIQLSCCGYNHFTLLPEVFIDHKWFLQSLLDL
jgi:hypothetical protein